MDTLAAIGADMTGVGCATRERSARGPAVLTPWCATCHRAFMPGETALLETPATWLRVLFGLIEGRTVVVETARPEMLAACVALCVHPGDERHIPLLGCRVTVPVFGHTVPVWPWPGVDITRGDGIAPVCTFAGPGDVRAWRDEWLETRVVIGTDGRLNALAGPYEGMSPSEARPAVVAALAERGLILGRRHGVRWAALHRACGAEAEYVVGEEQE